MSGQFMKRPVTRSTGRCRSTAAQATCAIRPSSGSTGCPPVPDLRGHHPDPAAGYRPRDSAAGRM